MNYQELSIKNLKEINKEFCEKVYKKYKYDCVIFVAKGAFLIGKSFSEFADVPLLEIYATRKGGKLKKILSPVLKILPEKLKSYLRKKEMKSTVHSKDPNREINFNSDIWKRYKKCKKILIVDDSIDTGYSALLAKNAVANYFRKSEVKVAVINLFDKAKEVYEPDFHLYDNTMIKGPWSNDSKENKRFLKEYYEWKEHHL